MTKIQIFFINNERYILNNTLQIVIKQPELFKLKYSEIIQLNLNNPTPIILPKQLTKAEINNLIIEEFKKDNNIQEKV